MTHDQIVEAGDLVLDLAIANIEKAKGLLREPEDDYEAGVQEGLGLAVDLIRRMKGGR